MVAPADPTQAVIAVSSVVALFVTGAAASAAFLQIRANAIQARENGALEAHRHLLCLCIERPELSSSDLMLPHLKRESFAGILDDLSEESERALWFVSFVLNTVELVLESKPNDRWWRTTMRTQIEYHEDLLREVWEDWREQYGERLQDLVDDCLSEADDSET